MADLFDVEGNKVEGAMTKEEIDTATTAAKTEADTAAQTATEQAKKESDDKITEAYDKGKTEGVQSAPKPDQNAEQLQKNLVDAQTELSNMQSKDYNWGEMRESAEKQQTEIGKKSKTILDLQEQIKTGEQNTLVESMITNLSAGDKGLGDKIRHHYGRLGTEAKSPEETKKQMVDAYTLATGKSTPGALDNVVHSGGAGDGATPPLDSPGPKAGPPLTEDQKDLGTKLGLSAEDQEKYDKPMKGPIV